MHFLSFCYAPPNTEGVDASGFILSSSVTVSVLAASPARSAPARGKLQRCSGVARVSCSVYNKVAAGGRPGQSGVGGRPVQL